MKDGKPKISKELSCQVGGRISRFQQSTQQTGPQQLCRSWGWNDRHP